MKLLAFARWLGGRSLAVTEIPTTEAAGTFRRTQKRGAKFDANAGGLPSKLGERRYLSVIIW
jgi:hypothetical protein